MRCDLLSKVSTFGIWNNVLVSGMPLQYVVTCSQKLVPLVSGTTYILRASLPCSCDLLSKVSTFGIWNNLEILIRAANVVVTCSQKLVPLVSGTTLRCQQTRRGTL